ncbi:hypothetical protein B0J13DRAFT_72323 [Dactylonectria estremocensis]|uniref:Uncharacterized protein n=1 Tax=Dactylonectria estremocensis TaxID=1079267 RepID=A0A9P9EGC4_9HYPO|nr:hypothetical protein B0J13DRAFT_72323 [Dactylonectria estremocensis]
MDPLADSKDAGTQTTAAHLNNPLMPPAKQQRILIWRTEVASALSLPTPSVASSHSSDSATSSTAAASPGPGPSPSRRPGFWKRLSWRLSSRHSRDGSGLKPGAEPTAMYRDDRPQQAVAGDDIHDEDDGALPDKVSDEGAGNGLRAKQERLQRAARLLNQGVREDEGATAIKAQRSRNGQYAVA